MFNQGQTKSSFKNCLANKLAHRGYDPRDLCFCKEYIDDLAVCDGVKQMNNPIFRNFGAKCFSWHKDQEQPRSTFQ